jgi:CubicO group peptidase (beta-lactamase class C family)
MFITAGAFAQTKEEVKLPATAAGERVAAYIKAFNSGDEQAMRSFITSNVSEAALKRRSVDERLAVYREMRGNMGTIELVKVLEVTPSTITGIFRTRSGGSSKIGFAFETEPPQKLLGLRVEDVESPEDAKSVAPPAATTQAKMSEAEFLTTLEKYLIEKVKADEFSGAVLVAKTGKPIFQKAYGLASKEHNVANRVDTKFNLGSINKLFTQVAVAQLADQGKLSLDDHLSKFIPDYPNREAANKITIRHLLTMSSGVGDIFSRQFDDTPKDKLRKLHDFLPLFASEPLAFEPGTQQRYSNGGYVLLGLIIEKVSGQSYYDYVRENIFKVAGMENTESFEADTIVPNLANGYTREGSSNRSWKNNIYSRPARGSSAGGGYSTADDMLKFTIAVANGKLRVPDYRGAGADSPASSPNNSNGPAPFGFAGGAPGINAIVLFNPASGFTTVVLSNYDEPSAETIGKQIRDWLRGVN